MILLGIFLKWLSFWKAGLSRSWRLVTHLLVRPSDVVQSAMLERDAMVREESINHVLSKLKVTEGRMRDVQKFANKVQISYLACLFNIVFSTNSLFADVWGGWLLTREVFLRLEIKLMMLINWLVNIIHCIQLRSIPTKCLSRNPCSMCYMLAVSQLPDVNRDNYDDDHDQWHYSNHPSNYYGVGHIFSGIQFLPLF